MLAVLQPSQAGVQAAARRGSGKEAERPIQPGDALNSSHGSTLHAEPCKQVVPFTASQTPPQPATSKRPPLASST